MNKLIIAFAFVITTALALSQGESVRKKILIAFTFVTATFRLSSLALDILARKPALVTCSNEDKLCED